MNQRHPHAPGWRSALIGVKGYMVKFRAKRKLNGNWVYGSYIQIGDDWCQIIPAGTEYDDIHNMMMRVITETVGVWTGLFDKNRNEIYEGDIIRTQYYTDRPYSKKSKSKQHIGVVVYKIGLGTAEWDVEIADTGRYGCSNWGAFYDCEVIGNIHENKDLLNVASK